ncbi:hypothetical protein, partial [Clostridium celatum]|uniref:hypothetical protein n=1 Tax=Clostridium celatum TaxID=36834 RepID=UPI002902EA69
AAGGPIMHLKMLASKMPLIGRKKNHQLSWWIFICNNISIYLNIMLGLSILNLAIQKQNHINWFQ